jgi:hypothetical protein
MKNVDKNRENRPPELSRLRWEWGNIETWCEKMEWVFMVRSRSSEKVQWLGFVNRLMNIRIL